MEKNEDSLLAVAQEALDNLEREGFFKKTGEYRRARSGELMPEYVMTEKGEAVADERAGSSIVH